VMINLESTFIKNFPRIKVNVLRSAIRNVGQGKQMQGYISHGVNVQSGHCEFLPEPLAKQMHAIPVWVTTGARPRRMTNVR
jgi:hypothetical protein